MVSSASSEASSALSSASSEMSSASSASSASAPQSCADLDIPTMMVLPADAAALAAVTSVTVFAVDDCTGLEGLAAMDVATATTLSARPDVVAALQAQGEVGAEIVAYNLDGTSLTVYVRKR